MDKVLSGVVLGFMLLLLSSVPSQAATEGICNDTAVFFCENWEDRQPGPLAADAGARFKNNGWSWSDASSPVVQTSEVFDGTRAIAMVTPAGQPSGGYVDTAFPNNQVFRTIYWRWYVKYSSNYTWSPNATKHNETVAVPGGQASLGVFNFTSNYGYRRPNVIIAAGNIEFQSGTDYSKAYFPPNVNGDFPQFEVNRWYCVEARITLNTGATAHDGYVQSWIDGVQHYEYPNVNVDSVRGDNSKHSGFFLASYWNCSGANGDDCTGAYAHPTIYRYMDNLVGSTARIGCIGAAQPQPPATPANLTVTSLVGLAPMLGLLLLMATRRRS